VGDGRGFFKLKLLSGRYATQIMNEPFPWVETHGYDHQSLRDACHCRVATTHISRGF